MLNHIHLIGYVGNPPECRLTQDDKKILCFSLATHKSWQQQDESWQKQTQWHKVTVFKDILMAWAEEKLKRGSLIYVQGELAYSKWEDSFKQARITPHILLANPASKILLLKEAKTDPDPEADLRLSETLSSPPPEEEEPLILPPHISLSTSNSNKE